MARKTHLRRNKLDGTNAPIAACASKSISGSVYRNSRSSYQFMASEIVGIVDFIKLPDNEVCSHCAPLALERRNRVRASHGKPPVSRFNEAG